MIQKISKVTLYVENQESAKGFWLNKLPSFVHWLFKIIVHILFMRINKLEYE